MMAVLILNFLLALVWIFLTGDISWENLFEGLIISYVILFIVRGALGRNKYFRKIPTIIKFFFYFLKELILANLMVAWDIITPTPKMRPGIIALDLDAKTNFEITMFANLITLTPGTLSLDVSEDKKTLYIHSLYIYGTVDEFKKSLKNGIERRFLEVTR
jgi:multicomponent Na+:H+ antiporter subunit E